MLEMKRSENSSLFNRGAAELIESWKLFGNMPPAKSETDVDRVILPLVNTH